MKKEIRSLYPDNWEELSKYVRFTIYEGVCQSCSIKQGELYPNTNKKAVIDCAHIDQNVNNNELNNLLALCKRCHWTYDNNYRGGFSEIKKKVKKNIFIPFI